MASIAAFAVWTTPQQQAALPPLSTGAVSSGSQTGPGMVGPAYAQQGASQNAGRVEIVVKFKDDASVKDIVDLFWSNESAARNRFETFSSREPGFAGLRLERVTYSNELVLCPEGPVDLSAVRRLVRALEANPDISYADPNMTAQPGDQ